MSLVIKDPITSNAAEVVDSMLKVLASVKSRLAQQSEEGEAYAWKVVSADIDAGDTALLVCNNSQTKKLYIKKIYLWSDELTQFKIHCPAYSASFTGTSVTGFNLNRVSNKAAEAIAYADETANTFAEANVFLTVRNTYRVRGNGDDVTDIDASKGGQWIDLEGALILGYRDSVAIDLIAETAAMEACIMGYYK